MLFDSLGLAGTFLIEGARCRELIPACINSTSLNAPSTCRRHLSLETTRSRTLPMRSCASYERSPLRAKRSRVKIARSVLAASLCLRAVWARVAMRARSLVASLAPSASSSSSATRCFNSPTSSERARFWCSVFSWTVSRLWRSSVRSRTPVL